MVLYLPTNCKFKITHVASLFNGIVRLFLLVNHKHGFVRLKSASIEVVIVIGIHQVLLFSSFLDSSDKYRF